MKKTKPDGIIYASPQNWRELFYKRIRDNRIGTLNTVDYLGRNAKMSMFCVIYWVGNQREVYFYGHNIKWLRRYHR